MKDEDYIEHLFVCSTHDYLLFFTNRGKVYRQKVYELPEAQRTVEGPRARERAPAARGRAGAGGAGHARLQGGQATSSSPPGRAMIKKTEFLAYNTPIKADGIIAIKIRDDDELVAVRRTERRRRHHHGLALRPGGALQRGRRCGSMGRDTGGVRGMNVVARRQPRARHGRRAARHRAARGHRRRLRQAHGDRGVPGQGPRHDGRKTIGLTEKKGGLAGALIVREHHDLVFISQNGMVQRTACKGSRSRAGPLRACA